MRMLSSSGSEPRVTSRQSAAAAMRSISEPLQRALFQVSDEVLAARQKNTAEELERRAIISMAVKHLIRERAQNEKQQIKTILEARQEALQALKDISPDLYAAAVTLQVENVPLQRRMLTLSPPLDDSTTVC